MFFDDDPNDGIDALPFCAVMFPTLLVAIAIGTFLGPLGFIVGGGLTIFAISQAHHTVLRWLGRLPQHPPAPGNNNRGDRGGRPPSNNPAKS